MIDAIITTVPNYFKSSSNASQNPIGNRNSSTSLGKKRRWRIEIRMIILLLVQQIIMLLLAQQIMIIMTNAIKVTI